MAVNLGSLLGEAEALVHAHPRGYEEWGVWAKERSAEERQALLDAWDSELTAEDLAPGERLTGQSIASGTEAGLQLLPKEFKDICQRTWEQEARRSRPGATQDPGSSDDL